MHPDISGILDDWLPKMKIKNTPEGIVWDISKGTPPLRLIVHLSKHMMSNMERKLFLSLLTDGSQPHK